MIGRAAITQRDDARADREEPDFRALLEVVGA